MGAVKRMMEEVAERMEIDDPNDERVKVEVERLLSLHQRRLVLIESHPNSGGFWVGKVGTEVEILSYLKEQEDKGTLDYVFSLLELKEEAGDEVIDWVEFDGTEPIQMREVDIGTSPQPTPPLPGLEKRLAGIQASVYGHQRSVWHLLQGMSDEEIGNYFSDCLEGMLQSGRVKPEERVG